MPALNANGLTFHVQELVEPPLASEGPPSASSRGRPKVIMIHGLVADNLSSYYYTIANPVAMIADTYLYDLRGHGRTEVPKGGYTVHDHVSDLAALIQAWGIDEPVHLVGNSFGGLIALAYANLFPDMVASIVLIEAHFATEGWGEHMAGSLALASFGLDEKGVKDWIDRYGSRKLTRLADHAQRLFTETSMIDDLEHEQPVPHQVLQACQAPVLAMYGEGSDLLDRAADLERHVPRCELHIVPNCSHSVLFEATPFVREQVLVWLDLLTGPPDRIDMSP